MRLGSVHFSAELAVENAPIGEWSWGGHRGRRSRVKLLDFTLTGESTMTEERLPLNELLQKAGGGDFLRAAAESVLQLHATEDAISFPPPLARLADSLDDDLSNAALMGDVVFEH